MEKMFNYFNSREDLKEALENGVESLQTLISYLLLPVALPLVFLQECYAWFKEKFGLNKRSMEGKVVLITGASAGIGEQLAHTFFNAGCRLILASRRKGELERVKDELVRKKSTGSRVYVPAVLEMDLSDLKSIPAKAKTALGIYNGIDILVNNAGVLHSGNALDTTLEVDKKIMDVNYFGTVALTKVIANSMKSAKSGHIIFMSSVSGRISIPHSSAYSASKHALQAFSDSLRAELSDFGVDVLVISPGYVKTNITINALTGDGSQYGKMTKNIAGGLEAEGVAQRIMKAIQNGEKDVVIATLVPRGAILLRNFTPNIFFFAMKYMARAFNKRDEAERQGRNN